MPAIQCSQAPVMHPAWVGMQTQNVITPVTQMKRGNGSMDCESTPPTTHSGVTSLETPCNHNSWDNVRVIKGQITLRCRVCQAQWRTAVDSVWRKRKCTAFASPTGCPRGEQCPKLHLHARKQSLTERLAVHGEAVLAAVPSDVLPAKIRTEEKSPSVKEDGSDGCSSNEVDSPCERSRRSEPCNHNSWDNVRVKKRQVTLRCRECQAQWRRPLDSLVRCVDFQSPTGCPQGSSCPRLHLHTYKQPTPTVVQRTPPATQPAPAVSSPSPTPAPYSYSTSPEPVVVPRTNYESSSQAWTTNWMNQNVHVGNPVCYQAPMRPAVRPMSLQLYMNGMSAVWPTSVVFEGVRAWADLQTSYVGVPACLLGATLIQGPNKGLPNGTQLAVVTDEDAEAFVVVECEGKDESHAAFTKALSYSGWQMSVEAPSRTDKKSKMVMFHTIVSSKAPLHLPATLTRDTVFSIFVKPVQAAYSTSTSLESSQTEYFYGVDTPRDDDDETTEETECMSTCNRGRSLRRSSLGMRSASQTHYSDYDSGSSVQYERAASCPPVNRLE